MDDAFKHFPPYEPHPLQPVPRTVEQAALQAAANALALPGVHEVKLVVQRHRIGPIESPGDFETTVKLLIEHRQPEE